MEIRYKNKRIRDICENEKKAIKKARIPVIIRNGLCVRVLISHPDRQFLPFPK